MANLAQYCIAEFDQTEVLNGSTLLYPRAKNGADAALSLAWAHMIGDAHGSAATHVFDPKIAGNLDRLKEKIDESICMQALIEDSVQALPNGGWSDASEFNRHEYITGAVLSPLRTAWYVEPTLLNYPELYNGTFFLILRFDAGVHMIGMIYYDGLLCLFDPNIGVLVAKNADEVAKVSAGIVAEYAENGMAIGQWAVYAAENA